MLIQSMAGRIQGKMMGEKRKKQIRTREQEKAQGREPFSFNSIKLLVRDCGGKGEKAVEQLFGEKQFKKEKSKETGKPNQGQSSEKPRRKGPSSARREKTQGRRLGKGGREQKGEKKP